MSTNYIPLKTQSQIKKQRKPKYKAQTAYDDAVNLASNYLSLSETHKGLLGFTIWGHMTLQENVFSQGALGKYLGFARETMNRMTTELHELGLIVKTSRGWKLVDVRNGNFKKNPCKYSLGKQFIEDLKFIGKNLTIENPILRQLFRAIPSLSKLLGQLVTVVPFLFTSFIGNKNNINTIDSESTFIGQDNYNIHKIYENERQSLTSIASIRPNRNEILALNVSTVEYRNIVKNEDVLQKEWHCYLEVQRNRHYKKENLKREVSKLANKDELVMPSTWCNLNKLGVNVMISGSDGGLTEENIRNIKEFPAVGIAKLKLKLKSYPQYRNNYKWIIENLIEICDMEDIKHLLLKHGFSCKKSKHLRELESRQVVEPVKNKEPRRINDFFKNLIGEDTCRMFEGRAGIK